MWDVGSLGCFVTQQNHPKLDFPSFSKLNHDPGFDFDLIGIWISNIQQKTCQNRLIDICTVREGYMQVWLVSGAEGIATDGLTCWLVSIPSHCIVSWVEGFAAAETSACSGKQQQQQTTNHNHNHMQCDVAVAVLGATGRQAAGKTEVTHPYPSRRLLHILAATTQSLTYSLAHSTGLAHHPVNHLMSIYPSLHHAFSAWHLTELPDPDTEAVKCRELIKPTLPPPTYKPTSYTYPYSVL